MTTQNPDPSDSVRKREGSRVNVSSKIMRRDERRGWTRFSREPETDFARIVTPPLLAGRVEVFDESLGGLGLVVTDAHLFRIGLVMDVLYAGSMYQVEIRHITPRDDGRYIVGVGCH